MKIIILDAASLTLDQVRRLATEAWLLASDPDAHEGATRCVFPADMPGALEVARASDHVQAVLRP